jgi:hypothetical protein
VLAHASPSPERLVGADSAVGVGARHASPMLTLVALLQEMQRN